MRVVLDTNILVSALIAPTGNPAAIYNVWEQGKFILLTCTEHLDELRATLQKPRVANLIEPYKAGRLVNQIKKLAENVGQRGDKSGLLVLARHKSARIITARDFANLFAADSR